MRSLLRFIFTFLSSVIIASCLLAVLFPAPSEPEHDHKPHNSLGGWFSFRDPAALFSPTATISLFDDNSTFFNAKPAAFGPSLPSKGLSGEVWVGSGFGDDNVNNRGMAGTMEGELGCGDIPGWVDRDWIQTQTREITKGALTSSKFGNSNSRKTKRDQIQGSSKEVAASKDMPDENDGSDDFFHWPLPKTAITPADHSEQSHNGFSTTPLEHTDIQSLQEAAEVKGKIVLLSRGGCGFAEKIKWAQRRGAIAVIVADDVRGGPLVRMYARGDTSNITIPSLFTSHTTAHLLSHLIPVKGSVDYLAVGVKSKPSGYVNQDGPSSSGMIEDSTRSSTTDNQDQNTNTKDSEASSMDGQTWLRVKDFEEDEAWEKLKKSPKKPVTKASDSFVIGVQDWRDPDMVNVVDGVDTVSSSASRQPKATSSAGSTNNNFKGGIITPGSGEYNRPGLASSEQSRSASKLSDSPVKSEASIFSSFWNWLKSIFHFSTDPPQPHLEIPNPPKSGTPISDVPGPKLDPPSGKKPVTNPEIHEGLWVTLTPTDYNASPFFNTLFVLVISPMITLAIVYSMLLVRARIRRRRWRAPKSVVERLPVRVYHALSTRNSSASELSEVLTISPTTPLLAGSRPGEIMSKTRSRAVSEAAASSMPSSSHYGSLETSAMEQEKVVSGLAEWKRKYGGKQKECVVCLEEYVDGVSRVMSLPCGHEFHVDCITPWLTTRRRTCPICKGDVVRSLNNPTTTNPPETTEMSEDDIQRQAAERSNQSPSAFMPIPIIRTPPETDVEQAGEDFPRSSSSGARSWLSRNFNTGFEYFSSQSSARNQSAPDRNR